MQCGCPVVLPAGAEAAEAFGRLPAQVLISHMGKLRPAGASVWLCLRGRLELEARPASAQARPGPSWHRSPHRVCWEAWAEASWVGGAGASAPGLDHPCSGSHSPAFPDKRGLALLSLGLLRRSVDVWRVRGVPGDPRGLAWLWAASTRCCPPGPSPLPTWPRPVPQHQLGGPAGPAPLRPSFCPQLHRS